MGASTAISWTDHTFNPWWGCERVSPGCQHCYAETFAKRTGHAVWGKTADRRFFGDKHWREPLRWDAAARDADRPALVFCASMADVFEDRADLTAERARLFDLIEQTPHLIWQLLTKRPQNVRRLVPERWLGPDEHGMVQVDSTHRVPLRFLTDEERGRVGWPANVWIGTTVEDAARAQERIPELLRIPAGVRFLSCEPLLGPVDLRRWTECGCGGLCDPPHPCPMRANASGRIGWVIVGGESGPGHRPLDLEHARRLVDQATRAGIPVLFKQVGGRTPTAGGDELDGRTWKQFPPEARR